MSWVSSEASAPAALQTLSPPETPPRTKPCRLRLGNTRGNDVVDSFRGMRLCHFFLERGFQLVNRLTNLSQNFVGQLILPLGMPATYNTPEFVCLLAALGRVLSVAMHATEQYDSLHAVAARTCATVENLLRHLDALLDLVIVVQPGGFIESIVTLLIKE
ncbi:hypothetical protein LTR95_016625 [Oleoguttula sp. CCFEE 5521]